MIWFKSHKHHAEKSISEKIERWSRSFNKNSMLNILATPYSSPDIFLNTVLNFMNSKKRVLYITNEQEDNIKFLKILKRSSGFRNYAYFRNNGSLDEGVQLIFSNHENAFELSMNFDLVIYDDISEYADYSRDEIEELTISKKTQKYLVYSVETVLLDGDTMEHVSGRNPFIEPRIVNTRIDLSKDIPYIIYDYIKWFIESKRNLIIYLPASQSRQLISEYLQNIDEEYEDIILDIENDYRRSLKKIKNKDIATIILTSPMYNIPQDVKNVDIIVYFADSTEFKYKRLLFVCGKVGISNSGNLGETIFLSNTVTENMTKAKEIARSFNKLAWESGLLKE